MRDRGRHFRGGLKSSPHAHPPSPSHFLNGASSLSLRLGHKHPELQASIPPHSLLRQLVPKHTKKVKPRKTATMSVPRRPAEAEEEAPKKGGQTKDVEARVGKARKVPRQPDKATKAPPGATGPRGKSKVKGRKNNPGRCVKRGGRRAQAATGCEDGGAALGRRFPVW